MRFQRINIISLGPKGILLHTHVQIHCLLLRFRGHHHLVQIFVPALDQAKSHHFILKTRTVHPDRQGQAHGK